MILLTLLVLFVICLVIDEENKWNVLSRKLLHLVLKSNALTGVPFPSVAQTDNARNQRARVMSHLFRRTEDKHGVEEPPENAHYGLPSDVLTPSDPDFLVRQRATSVPSIFKRYGSMSSLFKRVVPPRLYPSLAALFKRRLMTSLFKRNSLVYPEESPVLEPWHFEWELMWCCAVKRFAVNDM